MRAGGHLLLRGYIARGRDRGESDERQSERRASHPPADLPHRGPVYPAASSDAAGQEDGATGRSHRHHGSGGASSAKKPRSRSSASRTPSRPGGTRGLRRRTEKPWRRAQGFLQYTPSYSVGVEHDRAADEAVSDHHHRAHATGGEIYLASLLGLPATPRQRVLLREHASRAQLEV